MCWCKWLLHFYIFSLSLLYSSKSYYGLKYVSGIQNNQWFFEDKVKLYEYNNIIMKEEHFVNLLEDQAKSKILVWIENSKLHHEAENFRDLDCCTMHNFVWDPKYKKWKPKFEIWKVLTMYSLLFLLLSSFELYFYWILLLFSSQSIVKTLFIIIIGKKYYIT